MTTSTLTKKCQATIPKAVRDHLGLKPHERVSFSIERDKVILRRASVTTAELAGSLESDRGLPSESEVRRVRAKAASERDQRSMR